MIARPPMVATWLITRAVPEWRREEFLGDLEELFHVRLLERGRTDARRWYWRQSANVIADAMRERRRRPPSPAGDSVMQTIDHSRGLVSIVANVCVSAAAAHDRTGRRRLHTLLASLRVLSYRGNTMV